MQARALQYLNKGFQVPKTNRAVFAKNHQSSRSLNHDGIIFCRNGNAPDDATLAALLSGQQILVTCESLRCVTFADHAILQFNLRGRSRWTCRTSVMPCQEHLVILRAVEVMTTVRGDVVVVHMPFGAAGSLSAGLHQHCEVCALVSLIHAWSVATAREIPACR